ncbi:MAG: HD domain-containing protein [Clostridia bacterium]|nr:HD domain-containing protein [Clostridia bacterium]
MNNEIITVEQRILKVADTLEADARYTQTKTFIQHGSVSVYAHCVSVAAESLRIARALKLDVDTDSLIRGALLHDYFLYDWHDNPDGRHNLHGFTHPYKALKNAAEDFDLSKKECDIIVHHMFPLVPFPPHSKEAWIVCLADKICATRETILMRKASVSTR